MTTSAAGGGDVAGESAKAGAAWTSIPWVAYRRGRHQIWMKLEESTSESCILATTARNLFGHSSATKV